MSYEAEISIFQLVRINTGKEVTAISDLVISLKSSKFKQWESLLPRQNYWVLWVGSSPNGEHLKKSRIASKTLILLCLVTDRCQPSGYGKYFGCHQNENSCLWNVLENLQRLTNASKLRTKTCLIIDLFIVFGKAIKRNGNWITICSIRQPM